ncbi:replication protein [bacterium]|nr:replication protein [bacterium]
MSYPATHQEPYTQFPNRYNDTIKPRLTDTQRDICDVVIRQTSGWHQPSAPISNSEFMRKTRKSRQGIINAKNQLVDQGLLIVLEQGGGSTKNVYMLDLWYNNPDRSIKVAMLRQEAELLAIENQLPPLEQENIPELVIAPPVNEPTTFEEPEAVIETPPEIEESPNVDIPVPQVVEQVVESENSTPEEPSSEQGISHTEFSSNPVKIEVSEFLTSQLSVPPFKEEDLSTNLSINIKEEKKQTESSEEEAEAEKENRKTATATVCSLFRSWGEELEPNDYAFIGWSLKTYGVDAVQQKLDIMKFQRNRGLSFSSPLGWLRSALSRDYGFCSWDTEVLKGTKRADKASERAKLEQRQRECEIRETEKLRKQSEDMKAKLTTTDREDLRKKAIEQITKIPGVTKEWVTEILIQSEENQILRERMAG